MCSTSTYVPRLVVGDRDAGTERPLVATASRRVALGWLGAVWLVGWGPGTYAAVAFLLGYDTRRALTSWAQVPPVVLRDYLDTAVVVGLCLLALRATAPPLAAGARAIRLPRSRWDWQVEATLVLGGVVLAGLGFLVGNSIAPMSYPTPAADVGQATPGSARDALTSWTAGPAEEIFFTITTVLLARRAGFGWPVVFALSVAGRLAFHVYYGPGVLGLAIWAAGMVALYAITGRVLGLVIAHATWNLSQDLDDPFPAISDWVTWGYLLLLLALSAIAALTWSQHLRRARQRSRALQPPNRATVDSAASSRPGTTVTP